MHAFQPFTALLYQSQKLFILPTNFVTSHELAQVIERNDIILERLTLNDKVCF